MRPKLSKNLIPRSLGSRLPNIKNALITPGIRLGREESAVCPSETSGRRFTINHMERTLMSTISEFTALVFLVRVILIVPTHTPGPADSWPVLKSEILADWTSIREKYRAELATRNTFVTRGTMFGEKVKITYKIKGDLKIRHYESGKESTIIGYNKDYSFMLNKAVNGPWQLEHINLTDITNSKPVVRFPEVEEDFMSGDATNLQKSIEKAKSPIVQYDPRGTLIQLVFPSSDDVLLEHTQIDLDTSDGHYLPVRFSRRAVNGEISVHEFEWQISPSGLPTCVTATVNSGDMYATIESPQFDQNLSEDEFFVSHYGLPEPKLPDKTDRNRWLVLLVIVGVTVAGFGFYVKSRRTS